MSLTRASKLLQARLTRIQSVPAVFYHENVSICCIGSFITMKNVLKLSFRLIYIIFKMNITAIVRRYIFFQVVEHYENPRNVGSLDKKDQSVGTGLVGAPACGDVMKLQIKVDENGKIIDAKFKTFGCGSAIASSSLATEWVKGKTIDEAGKLKNTDIAKELCLPPVKLHCSMLAEDAIKAALADYKIKQQKKD